MRIQLSQKQKQAIFLLNNPVIVDLLLGGGAGGAKSLTMCIWALIQMHDYPGIRIGLGRKELTRLKQTTVITLLREAHPIMGVNEHEFKYNENKGLIEYVNKSSIQLVDLAFAPGDPDFDRLGSLNFTHTLIEEGGEIVKKAKDVFTSRKNRYLNREYGIVGKSLTTCNPSQNFLKQEYYEPYKKLGSGEYQQWEFGKVEVNGVMKTAYRAFLKSLATDNPFLPRNYIEVLRKLPPAEKKRLLQGNWDYKDDDSMLFKSSLIDRSLEGIIKSGKKSIGVDIGDTGKDPTILSLVENDMLVDAVKIEVDKDKPIGEQIALAIIKYAQQHGFRPEDAKDIAIDGIGVGTSTRDFLKSKGWNVRLFMAGASSTNPIYKNLRGEALYEMSQAMDKGTFKIYTNLPMLQELRDQLMAHEYITEERKILIPPKKDIKKTLGRSPDNAESAYIAFWVSKGDNDDKHNSNRIAY